jgi:single-stranded-DNA-specific exonuclease
LSGVGMVYKFCCYIDSLLGVDHAQRFKDLVAVGMIDDMMALTSFETKELIAQGLKAINNPFLSAVVENNEF